MHKPDKTGIIGLYRRVNWPDRQLPVLDSFKTFMTRLAIFKPWGRTFMTRLAIIDKPAVHLLTLLLVSWLGTLWLFALGNCVRIVSS